MLLNAIAQSIQAVFTNFTYIYYQLLSSAQLELQVGVER